MVLGQMLAAFNQTLRQKLWASLLDWGRSWILRQLFWRICSHFTELPPQDEIWNMIFSSALVGVHDCSQSKFIPLSQLQPFI